MKSEFEVDVLDGDELLTLVIRIHLHIERFLHGLVQQALPNPQAIFRTGNNPRFSHVLTLCHALALLPEDLIGVLRKLNRLRNDYAHERGFFPDRQFIQDFLVSLRELDDPFFMSFCEPTEGELLRSLASLAGYLQKTYLDRQGIHPTTASTATIESALGESI